jgi:uncharacterized protein (TIGR01777 family)
MNVVVTGGSGFIGRALCHALCEGGHHVAVLSRNPQEAKLHLDPSVTIIGWDGLTRGAWERSLEGAEGVINLAGEPIAAARWTAGRKQALRDSRIGTTRLLIQALAHLADHPGTLINASAIGYYGADDSAPATEAAPAGSGFLADLCVLWEQEAVQAERLGVRVVRLRIGMVLGEDGGALPRMLPPFRLFLGGPILPGDQYISWIHRQDLIGLIRWALTDAKISGPINGAAPGAVTMKEFSRILGRVLRRPSWLPVPEFALRVALGEMSTLLTTGPRVEPAAARRGGYRFRYPSLEPALREILCP